MANSRGKYVPYKVTDDQSDGAEHAGCPLFSRYTTRINDKKRQYLTTDERNRRPTQTHDKRCTLKFLENQILDVVMLNVIHSSQPI